MGHEMIPMGTHRAIPALHIGLIALCLALAYAGSLNSPFIFDDGLNIVENPSIQTVFPLSGPLAHIPPGTSLNSRPLVNLTFALNYAVGGLSPWSYHLGNLLIHILAALALYGIVRRTLLLERPGQGFGEQARPLALACALAWGLHPLQTQAVTYVTQRCESLMGLLFLAVLYCALRGWQARRSWPWHTAAVLACLAGVWCKEVIVAAPVMVYFHDLVFLRKGRIVEPLKRSPWLYAGLAGCLALLAWNVLQGGTWSSGPGTVEYSSLEYARTQPLVIFHYLRLAVWPAPLVLDYAWPVASMAEAWPYLAALAALACLASFGLVRAQAWGYCLAWFLVVLAPTSSIVPLRNLAFEHRMYLPLAGIICLAVPAGYLFLSRRCGFSMSRLRWSALVLVLALGAATVWRNLDYASDIAIWRDTVEKRPNNARAHANLGQALLARGRVQEARDQLQAALALDPDHPTALLNLGVIMAQANDLGQAAALFQRAAEEPGHHLNAAKALYNLGRVHLLRNDPAGALALFKKALALRPGYQPAAEAVRALEQQ